MTCGNPERLVKERPQEQAAAPDLSTGYRGRFNQMVRSGGQTAPKRDSADSAVSG
jgi:hypothetical protein